MDRAITYCHVVITTDGVKNEAKELDKVPMGYMLLHLLHFHLGFEITSHLLKGFDLFA